MELKISENNGEGKYNLTVENEYKPGTNLIIKSLLQDYKNKWEGSATYLLHSVHALCHKKYFHFC